jgi:hypothetical protein
MTWTEYQRKTNRELAGRKVRALRVLTTGVVNIPAGQILTIKEKRGGLTLQSSRCKCCGVSLYLRKVEPQAVELI